MVALWANWLQTFNKGLLNSFEKVKVVSFHVNAWKMDWDSPFSGFCD